MTVRETSIQTYHELQEEGVINKNQEIILRFMKNSPPMTDRELAKNLNYEDPNKVRPRRKELVDLGLLCELGKRKCRITGRKSLVWFPKDKFEITKKIKSIYIKCPKCKGNGMILSN